MKEFGACVAVWVAVILIPVYFVWMLACITQGHWITMSIFDWPNGARGAMVFWTIFVTCGALFALTEV